MRKNSYKIISIIFVLLKMYLCNSRQKRFLIYEDATPSRAQFIFGIGIPLDLETESLTSGYVFKLEYYLPARAEQLRQLKVIPQRVGTPVGAAQQIEVSKRSISSNSTIHIENALILSQKIKSTYESKKLLNYRWAIYKGFEKIIERMGHPGRPCLLRSICEASETSFHYHGGILGDLMHIIMTPSTSIDDMSHHASNIYFYAEKMGESGAPCDRIFKDCKESILGRFSNIFSN